jgi:hypothetical protein
MENTNIIGVIAVVALLLGVASVGAIYTGYIKGEQGDQGIIGQVGPMGPTGSKGDMGDMPSHEWNDTDIRFELPDGTWSEWIDLKGDTGEKGSKGDTGATGPVGPKGEDCPINEIADIDILNNSGIYWSQWFGWPHYKNKYYYQFDLLVDVDDPEDDNMHITFYYRENECDLWDEVVEYIGVDGNYIATVTWNKWEPAVNQTIYWLVETWDGSDLGFNYYNCTIDVTL